MKTLGAMIVAAAMLGQAFGETATNESRLVANLKAGRHQTVVAYGTSLTSRGAWVDHLRAALDAQYPGLATVVNSGQSAKNSQWGVENLHARVLDHKPDTVFIEFSVNDAYLPYTLSIASAQSNLNFMIDAILQTHGNCEVILMVMNPVIGQHLKQRPAIEDYNQMVRRVSIRRQLMLVDHYPKWESLQDTNFVSFARFMPDGIHPSAEGCSNIVTPTVFKALGLVPERSDNIPSRRE